MFRVLTMSHNFDTGGLRKNPRLLEKNYIYSKTTFFDIHCNFMFKKRLNIDSFEMKSSFSFLCEA